MTTNPPKPDTNDYEAVTEWRRACTEPRALACPYCGGLVTVTGDGGGSIPYSGTAECDAIDCGAEWDGAGRSTQTPAQFQVEVDRLARRWRH